MPDTQPSQQRIGANWSPSLKRKVEAARGAALKLTSSTDKGVPLNQRILAAMEAIDAVADHLVEAQANARPPTVVENGELRTAAQAVVDRWDTLLWKDAPHTAEFIKRLRAALAAQQAEPLNLNCKSVQKRLAAQWGFVPAERETYWRTLEVIAVGCSANPMRDAQEALIEGGHWKADAVLPAAKRAQEAFAADSLEQVHGDVLPPIGSTVYILHGRDDDAHECQVVGYYAWPALLGDRWSHRVFVRLAYAGTENLNARHLTEVWPTAAAALASRATPRQERSNERRVRFVGVDPLDPTKGAALPMIPDSWRFGFTEQPDGSLTFGPRDAGPFVAHAAAYPMRLEA